MDQEERTALEATIRGLHAEERLDEAARVALEGYGPEILGFLMALTRDADAASDRFGQFCEDMWRGLPGFRWASSFRTWAYTLARNAHHRALRDPHVRRGRRLETGELGRLQANIRTQTLPYLLTAVKDRFAALRQSLAEEDQALLILRLDRRMSWREIAEVLHAGEAAVDEEGLKRRAAALRKRYERVKARLRELAAAEGLLGDDAG